MAGCLSFEFNETKKTNKINVILKVACSNYLQGWAKIEVLDLKIFLTLFINLNMDCY